MAERDIKEKTGKSPILVCKYPLQDTSSVKYYPSDLHSGIFQHAVDIASCVDQQILSPVYGKITDLKQYSTRWIPWKEDLQGKVNPSETLNWLTIQVHTPEKFGIRRLERYVPNGCFVQLCHLAPFSCDKCPGDFIQAGEPIARVGLSGAITLGFDGEPEVHLHIAAFEQKAGQLESLKIFFSDPQIPNPYE